MAAAVSAMTAPAKRGRAGHRVVFRLPQKLDRADQTVLQAGEMPLQPHGQLDVAQPGAQRADQVRRHVQPKAASRASQQRMRMPRSWKWIT